MGASSVEYGYEVLSKTHILMATRSDAATQTAMRFKSTFATFATLGVE